MSTSEYYPDSYHLKLCPFPPSFNTTSHYVCFKYERCCPQGCCYSFSYTYFQSWYFWLLVAVFFAIFYIASWYCKNLEKRRRRVRVRNVEIIENLSQPRSGRNDDTNVDNLLDTLMQTYRARNINETRPGRKYTDPPPKYRDAIHMPKLEENSVQMAETHSSSRNSATDDRTTNTHVNPPTYEDATKRQQGDNV